MVRLALPPATPSLTCPRSSYANSVLQALYFCSPFRNLVIQQTDSYPPLQNALSLHSVPTHPPTSPASPARRKPDRTSTQDPPQPNAVSHPPTPPVPSAPRTLFSALRALYSHISKNPADKGTIAPRAFIEKLRELNEAFRNTMHQDAHEFLNYLLNRIVEEIEEEKKQRLASGDDRAYNCPPPCYIDIIPSTTLDELFFYCLSSPSHDCEHVHFQYTVARRDFHTSDIPRHID